MTRRIFHETPATSCSALASPSADPGRPVRRPTAAKLRVLLDLRRARLPGEGILRDVGRHARRHLHQGALPQSAELFKPGLEKEYDAIVCYDMVKELKPEHQQRPARPARPGHRPGRAAPQPLGQPRVARVPQGHRRDLALEEADDRRPRVRAVDVRARPGHPDQGRRQGPPDHEGARRLRDPRRDYGNTYVSPSVHVLLKADNPKNVEPFAWTNHYGKSRIVYFQAGHDAEAWKSSNFQEILGRSIRWVAGKDRTEWTGARRPPTRRPTSHRQAVIPLRQRAGRAGHGDRDRGQAGCHGNPV